MQVFIRMTPTPHDLTRFFMWCCPYLSLSTLYSYAVTSKGLFSMEYSDGISEELSEVEKTLKIKRWEF